MKVLLDPGHGGVLWGQHYFTRGKRSPQVGPGVGIYEGEFNRKVAFRVAEHLDSHMIPCHIMGSLVDNMPLSRRVKFANEVYRLEPDTVLVSIHANAAKGKGWSGGNGSRIFACPSGSKKTWDLAEKLMLSFKEISPNTWIKKNNFTIIYRTHCPAVLVECGFMTNFEEAAFMASDEGVMTYALAITEGLLAFEWGQS
jgi:N-acetylmuramoyl-L-alanine amidase